MAAVSSCGDPGPGGDHLDTLPRFVLQEELRIGSAAGPLEGFTRIGGVELDEDGLVYVMETEDRHIRVYDAQGTRVRTIGRAGEGPGEFAFRGASARFGILGDTLWVTDTGSGRFTRFTLAGELIDAVQTAQTLAEVIPGVPLGLRPAEYIGGGRFISTYSIPGGAMGAIVASTQPVLAPVVKMDRMGVITDTIRYETVRGSSANAVTVAGQRITVPQPPGDGPLYADGAGVTFVVERAVPQVGEEAFITVLKLTSPADTSYARRIRYTPREWSPERVQGMMATSLRLWSNRVGGSPDTSAAATAVREAMVLPPFQPVVSAIRVGDDEVVWLTREEDPAAPPELVMIGADGRPLGVVASHPKTTLHWSSDETVWATVLDELDVPWLVRFRLARTN
jgi:hypothetical protein